MPRKFAHKLDGNQHEIAEALREAGANVRSIAQCGFGMPDLLVGYQRMTFLLEVKLPQSAYVKGGKGGKRERTAEEYDPRAGFTDDERRFHDAWQGQPIITVRSVDEALIAIGAK